MSTTYLDFEEPLRELEEQIQQTRELGEQTQVDMQEQITELEAVLADKTKEVFANLTPWPRSSASKPGNAPGVSIKVTIGLLNFSANFMRRKALR